MGSLAECEYACVCLCPVSYIFLPTNLYNTLANAVAELYCDLGSHNWIFNIKY